MAASNGSEYYDVVVGDAAGNTDSFGGRPSNGMQDEEELIWAAIERLPSRKRSNFALLRRTLSNSDDGDCRTEAVDVRKLDRSGRELVVARALATSEQDNYMLLSAVKQRLDRVGIEIPKVEVRYENLNIKADVVLGSRALPTLVNYSRDIIEVKILFDFLVMRET